MSIVMFARALEKKGFRKVKTMTGMRWTGLKPLGATEIADKETPTDE